MLAKQTDVHIQHRGRPNNSPALANGAHYPATSALGIIAYAAAILLRLYRPLAAATRVDYTCEYTQTPFIAFVAWICCTATFTTNPKHLATLRYCVAGAKNHCTG